jgi:hypothetical protein
LISIRSNLRIIVILASRRRVQNRVESDPGPSYARGYGRAQHARMTK